MSDLASIASLDAATRFEPTSRRGQRTRAALLAGARRVFEELGVTDANVAAITRAAGVGYGSFYIYFASKQEIFEEVVRLFVESIFEDSRTPPDADFMARVTAENHRFFQLYRENTRMFTLIEEQAAIDPHFAAVRTRVREGYARRTVRALRRLQARGEVDPELDPEYTTLALLAMTERMARFEHELGLDDELLERTVEQLWRNAIGYRPRG